MKKKVRITSNSWTRSYEIEAEISFDGCSEEQLREWAMRERIIALQRVLRSRGEAYVDSLGGRLVVKAAEIGNDKVSVDTFIRKLSPEEKLKLLELLQQT